MKLDFSNLFGEGGRSRVFIVAVGAVVVTIVAVAAFKIIGQSSSGDAEVRVAQTASGVKSVQGGEVTPQYAKLIQQSNEDALKRARIQGTSAIPTLINYGQTSQQPIKAAGDCSACCGSCGDNICGPGVDDLLDAMVRNSEVSAAIAQEVSTTSAEKKTPKVFSESLQEDVRGEKISPAQARKLYKSYECHYTAALVKESAALMDNLIQAGRLPIEAADALMALEKAGVSPEEYKKRLAQMVAEGKISPEVAQQLLDAYRKKHSAIQQKDAQAELDRLMTSGQIGSDVAAKLKALQKAGVSSDDYRKSLEQMVRDGKISPQMAEQLLQQYKNVLGETEDQVAQRLLDRMKVDSASKALLDTLESRKATPEEYAAALKRLVAEGKLTPEQAAELMADYQKRYRQGGGSGVLTPQEQLARAQKLQQEQLQQQRELQERQIRSQQELQMRQQELQQVNQIAGQMNGQVRQLLTSWKPITQSVVVGEQEKPGQSADGQAGQTPAVNQPGSGAPGEEARASAPPPVIKAGDIEFAVLDTAVDSDYPSSPVMATVVSGKFRGAKLMGRLQKEPDGERVSLQFNLMTNREWKRSIQIAAFAIDPDSAKTALATSVNHHYLQRYGTLFASSFIEGFADAISKSGTTATTSALGSQTTTTPELNPKEKIFVGLGKVGKNLAQDVQKNMNRQPTVKINSGVGMGILFTQDVAKAGE